MQRQNILGISRTPLSVWSVAAALLVIAAACSSDKPNAAQTTAKLPTTSTTIVPTTSTFANSDDRFPNGLRNARYCEVVFVQKIAERFQAEVWNSLGENECPDGEWNALDVAQFTKQHNALLALKNGPRFFLMDSILSNIREAAETTKFGPIGMFKAATVDLGTTSPVQTPYAERKVTRTTVFRFKAGTHVHELTDANGTVYIMQAYATFVDKSLSIDNLDALETELKLPAGWKYSNRTLTKNLDVYSAQGIAFVIQDELQNTYQRVDPNATG